MGEPDEKKTLAILRALRPKYEAHHGLAIEDGALSSAVTLSKRYLPDRFLPDKAIDLVDEAAAGVRMSARSASPALREMEAVSYTHLDVYKRQVVSCGMEGSTSTPMRRDLCSGAV